jgi:hypothetical protein
MAKAPQKETEITVLEISQGSIDVCILGESPLICNRMTNKGARELLMPRGKKTAVEKASTLKHEPLREYRASPYTTADDRAPTRIQLLGSMFKRAMMTAALDLPGTKKAQIGRLVYIENDRISVWGTPQLMMSITRSADINKTPDVRTRAIVPRWAARLTVKFVRPVLREQSVANLLAAGGVTSGIGDWRVEKGSGSYGRYRLTSPNDPEFAALMAEGREAQDAALQNPECYDDETRDLYAWYCDEVTRRGFKAVA